jgi:putative inorganic carbon (hco3(-)) transporter
MLAILYGGTAGIILGGLLVSWSRGAWIGFAGAVVVMIWLTPPKFWQGTLALGFVGTLFVLLWTAGLLPASITSRITSFTEDFSGFKDMRGAAINDENFAVVERLAHWQAAIRMAEEHPLLGVGFGNYEPAYENFSLINWTLALGHAHNYYLNLLAETGIIGLTAYLVMGAIIIWLTFRAIQKANSPIERGIAVGLMGVWTHLSIHSLFDKLYVNNLFLMVGVLLGLLAVLLHHSQNERPSTST